MAVGITPDFAPSQEEIEALRAEQPIKLKVHFTDHSFKNFVVDEDLTVGVLVTSISTTLKVKLIETYSLYDVSTISEPICLSKYGGILSFGASRTAPLVQHLLVQYL